MTLAALVASASRRGVRLAVSGDRLRIEAPPGAITPGLREALAIHKPDLIRWLIQEHNAAARALLDRFFTGEIVPRLAALSAAGVLPALARDPDWLDMERQWTDAAPVSAVRCDVVAVQRAMRAVVERYERTGGQDELFRA